MNGEGSSRSNSHLSDAEARMERVACTDTETELTEVSDDTLLENRNLLISMYIRMTYK